MFQQKLFVGFALAQASFARGLFERRFAVDASLGFDLLDAPPERDGRIHMLRFVRARSDQESDFASWSTLARGFEQFVEMAP